MSSAPGISAATFAELDVLDGRGFAAVYAYVGLGNWRQRLTLAAAIVVPLILFWCATSREHRFLLNSLVQEGFVDGKAWRIVGVSFVGDPMVWGYSILVPFLVAVLGVAAQRTLNLVNTASAKATPAWRSDKSSTGFAQAVRETCQIWRVEPAGHPKIRIILRVAPWILAVAMLAYNALTCGLHDLAYLPYPYTSAHVTLIEIEPAVNALAPHANPTVHPPVQSPNETDFDGREVSLVPAGRIQSTTRELQQPIPLRKWDCEPRIAPFSFWLARAWTLFYYCSLPFLLREIVLLVWGATHFLSAGQRWEEPGSDKEPNLHINPFESDGFGGLGALADAAVIYCYCVSVPAALLGLSFFKEGVPSAWHDYLLMGLYIPIGAWLALTPVLAVHRAIVGCKDRMLSVIADKMNVLSEWMLLEPPRSNESQDTKTVDEQRQAYSRLFAEVKQMKEWPFDVMSVARIALSIGAPWLPALIKEMASNLLGLAGHPGS
jgi:hypothetical protein